jgi:hypothetical protein
VIRSVEIKHARANALDVRVVYRHQDLCVRDVGIDQPPHTITSSGGGPPVGRTATPAEIALAEALVVALGRGET